MDEYVIEAQAVEWIYIITKLVGRHKAKPSDLRITLEQGYPVYHIKRQLIKPEVLAKAIGVTTRQIVDSAFIRLKPLKPTFPKEPNVKYYGEA